MNVDWSTVKYFKEEEFTCHHCGESNMDADFVAKLDEIREAMEVPITVTSGYRCPAHNAAVSTTGNNGPHTTGKAADIIVAPEHIRGLLTVAVMMFPGVGVNLKGTGRFIHVDNLKPRAWSY